MANFAYITNGQIDSVYDLLPTNWRNISNFNALVNDEETLNSHGWYKITKVPTVLNPDTQRFGKVHRWIGEDGVVYETEEAVDIDLPLDGPTAEELLTLQWEKIRHARDLLIASVLWRIERYNRETRMNITHIDDITIIDEYIQALADIPNTQQDPYNIVWPELNLTIAES